MYVYKVLQIVLQLSPSMTCFLIWSLRVTEDAQTMYLICIPRGK